MSNPERSNSCGRKTRRAFCFWKRWGVALQASGFEDKEARDCPACLVSPGMREDPGSSAPLKESASVAPAPAGRVPGPPRAAAWVCGGGSRSRAGPAQSGGREGKHGRRGVRKEGNDGGKQTPSRVDQEEALLSQEAKREGDPDTARGGRKGEQDPEASALLPLLPCWGVSLLHAHPTVVSSFL